MKNQKIYWWKTFCHMISACVICKISNFNMWTAEHLAQASCTEFTLLLDTSNFIIFARIYLIAVYYFEGFVNSFCILFRKVKMQRQIFFLLHWHCFLLCEKIKKKEEKKVHDISLRRTYVPSYVEDIWWSFSEPKTQM